MDITKILETLHPLERKVLQVFTPTITVSEIITTTKLQEVEVMRALQWLAGKNIIKLTTTTKELLNLGQNGQLFITKGLPERRILNALAQGPVSTKKLLSTANITQEELSVSLGILKTNNAITIIKNQDIVLTLTTQGKELLKQKFPEETFLTKKFPLDPTTLSLTEKKIFETLKKRKDIIQTETKRDVAITLLDLGKRIQKYEFPTTDVVDHITPDLLKTNAWKGKTFRRYDLTLEPPLTYTGRRQHYRAFLDSVREHFIALGFTEMTGPLVETEFWNMDALYMPQFHSARDIHDVYHIKEPTYTKLDAALIKKVKAAHEHGAGTGSTGWCYCFDEQRTQRNILRSHDTSISSRTLASKELHIPGKYFQISRCFRKDVIDATHLPDFNQVGGFVIDNHLNLRHLFGLLKQFAQTFAGTKEIKLVPAYFPFTEPSVELYAKHPHLGWIELGGAGIFRPELVKPLVGKEVPVIAWGIGIDRIAMFKLGLKDIRSLFSHDLESLRTTKVHT